MEVGSLENLGRLLNQPIAACLRAPVDWDSFLQLSPSELQQRFREPAYLHLCEVQWAERDRRRGRHVERARPYDLHRLEPFPFVWGMREPFTQRTRAGSYTRARFRYLRDVVGVRQLIVLEARHFGLEKRLWRQMVGGKVELVDIPDWHLPTDRELESFGLAVAHAREQGQALACHCIAGLGRTGICFLFLLALVSEGDLADLLLQLARDYNPEASIEILTMLHERKFQALELWRNFRDAAIHLRRRLGSWPERIPELPNHTHLTPTQLQRLAREHLEPDAKDKRLYRSGFPVSAHKKRRRFRMSRHNKKRKHGRIAPNYPTWAWHTL
jgi:protein-tyrosine phosphatase